MKYFNNLGHLYPDRTKKLNESKDFGELVGTLDSSSYHKYFKQIPDPIKAEQEPEIELDTTIDDV